MKKSIFFLYCCLLVLGCQFSETSKDTYLSPKIKIKKDSIYTLYSSLPNSYQNFNSQLAINKLATIENQYFNAWEDGVSSYYGTVWRESAEITLEEKNISMYEYYLNSLNSSDSKADSLHCTLYAYEGLKAGLDSLTLDKIEQYHRRIYKDHEIAGWSLAYILVRYFDWEAYLILDTTSVEFDHCIKAYKRNQKYPVWKRPDIALKQLFIRGKDNILIDSLLQQHEFGWGFSEQGYHTWISRFDQVKECNWDGAPSKRFQLMEGNQPLFIRTNFFNYYDYGSHVIIFPKKKNLQN